MLLNQCHEDLWLALYGGRVHQPVVRGSNQKPDADQHQTSKD